MSTEFSPGMKVTWLYWPPDVRYRMCKNVAAEVISTTKSRIKIRCWDKRGNEHTRHVDPNGLLVGEWPDDVYADNYYPVNGDAPEYRKR